LTPLAVIVAATSATGGAVFWEGLKTGLLTFGGAFTAVPFLQQAAVDNHHWLTDSQFVDGLALGGILPAPLIIFSTFVGYLAGGLVGGIVMTLGVFIPAFALPIYGHDLFSAVAEHPRVRALLLGVAAGVIGLIAAVTVDIIDTSIIDVPTALLAIAAFLALMRWHGKLTVLYVVLGCGAIGALLQATVV
jgi:chromate transporter